MLARVKAYKCKNHELNAFTLVTPDMFAPEELLKKVKCIEQNTKHNFLEFL